MGGQILASFEAINPPAEVNPAHVELQRMMTKKMRRPKKKVEGQEDDSEEDEMDEAADDDEDEYEDEDVRIVESISVPSVSLILPNKSTYAPFLLVP